MTSAGTHLPHICRLQRSRVGKCLADIKHLPSCFPRTGTAWLSYCMIAPEAYLPRRLLLESTGKTSMVLKHVRRCTGLFIRRYATNKALAMGIILKHNHHLLFISQVFDPATGRPCLDRVAHFPDLSGDFVVRAVAEPSSGSRLLFLPASLLRLTALYWQRCRLPFGIVQSCAHCPQNCPPSAESCQRSSQLVN